MSDAKHLDEEREPDATYETLSEFAFAVHLLPTESEPLAAIEVHVEEKRSVYCVDTFRGLLHPGQGSAPPVLYSVTAGVLFDGRAIEELVRVLRASLGEAIDEALFKASRGRYPRSVAVKLREEKDGS